MAGDSFREGNGDWGGHLNILCCFIMRPLFQILSDILSAIVRLDNKKLKPKSNSLKEFFK